MPDRRRFHPIDPVTLLDLLAADLVSAAGGGRLRVAVDGPLPAAPDRLAAELAVALRAQGRMVAVLSADTFWRDASVRLEHGRHDVHAYGHDWLDVPALRREVLDPLGPAGSGRYLPSLRDPVRNRATRQPALDAPPELVLLVIGGLLLGHRLPFDRTIHLALSQGARRRRTPEALSWTLAAYDEYEREVDPIGSADIVIRVDDPEHPAVSLPIG